MINGEGSAPRNAPRAVGRAGTSPEPDVLEREAEAADSIV
jgi:hypothetical protein